MLSHHFLFSGCLLVRAVLKGENELAFWRKFPWFLTSSFLKRSYFFSAEQGKFSVNFMRDIIVIMKLFSAIECRVSLAMATDIQLSIDTN